MQDLATSAAPESVGSPHAARWYARPQGAQRLPDGSVQWTVWAPLHQQVELVLFETEAVAGGRPRAAGSSGARRHKRRMQPAGEGYFVHCESPQSDGPPCISGLQYAYRLGDEELLLPDPASRWQPEGVHRQSALYFPEDFAWRDSQWRGVPLERLTIYELHVGTFTPEGTFEAIIPRLAALRELGVTALEIMPISQFPGARNWGYDGVHPYSAQHSYGGPEGFQKLVAAAHAAGLAIILDVVYNHLGPEGNYLSLFGPYFNSHYLTPWGPAINYDGPHCEPVRSYMIESAVQWVCDYHVDGLRLDAIQTIYDMGARHFLAELQEQVQQAGREAGRHVVVIGETDQNDVRLINPPSRGGYGLHAIWADDFHHSVHTTLSGEREGYYADFGPPEMLAKCYNAGFVYDGLYSPYRHRRHGRPLTDQPRSSLVYCIQNHDQVGNRALGERLDALVSPAARRLAAALLLIAPGTPMLFMGEEYGESRPFPFFCSFEDQQLVDNVRRGRRAEFEALRFRWGLEIPDPQDEATFRQAVLSWDWSDAERAGLRNLYCDLLRARREWPALKAGARCQAMVMRSPRDANSPVAAGSTDAAQGPDEKTKSARDELAGVYLVVRRASVDEMGEAVGHRSELIATANLGDRPAPFPAMAANCHWRLLSTADARYTGQCADRPDGGRAPVSVEAPAVLGPYELVIHGPESWRR